MSFLQFKSVPINQVLQPKSWTPRSAQAFDFTKPIELAYTKVNLSIFPPETMLLLPNSQPFCKKSSYLLNRNNELLLTPYSTRQLIQHYNKSQIVDFSHSRHFYNCFNYARKYPVVNGDFHWLPLNGSIHRDSTWIALHYVAAYEESNHNVLFRFLNGTTCELPHYGHALSTEIHNAIAIGRICRACLTICALNFGYRIQLESPFMDSIVHQFDNCDCKRCCQIPENRADLIQLLNQLEINKTNFIYRAAQAEYSEYPTSYFAWYTDVDVFIKRLRRL